MAAKAKITIKRSSKTIAFYLGTHKLCSFQNHYQKENLTDEDLIRLLLLPRMRGRKDTQQQQIEDLRTQLREAQDNMSLIGNALFSIETVHHIHPKKADGQLFNVVEWQHGITRLTEAGRRRVSGRLWQNAHWTATR